MEQYFTITEKHTNFLYEYCGEHNSKEEIIRILKEKLYERLVLSRKELNYDY